MGSCNEVVFLGGVERQEEEETTEQGWVPSGAGTDLFKWYGLSRSQHSESRKGGGAAWGCCSCAAMTRSCHWVTLSSPVNQAQGAQEREANLSQVID